MAGGLRGDVDNPPPGAGEWLTRFGILEREETATDRRGHAAKKKAGARWRMLPQDARNKFGGRARAKIDGGYILIGTLKASPTSPPSRN
jgi:hypothetical protein